MDPFTRKTLSSTFQQLGEWRETRNTESKVPLDFRWSQFHLSVIHGYILKLNIAPDSKLLSLANTLDQESSNTAAYDDIAASLVHTFQEAVFVVPQPHHQFQFERDVFIDRSELVAAFLDMLLRLLHSGPGSAKWTEGQIDRLQKVLRFLLAVLGDESFDSTDLLAEFEAVANRAGTLVHLIIFSTTTVKEKRFRYLLRHVDSLIAKIDIKREQVSIAEAYPSQKKAAAMNSLFIIDSLLDTLEDLLSKEGAVLADVADQIRTLQQELKRTNSYIKKSTLPQSNEFVMRTTGAAYEAEYLLNSFLVENVSCRYFSAGLSHVIRNIMLVNSEVQGIEENFETRVVSEFAQLSLQDKSGSDVEDVIGFDEKELEVLEYLYGGEKDLQIVAICGMPGVGKTTLAKELYNHPFLKDIFDTCSWSVVSQRYHMKNLLIDILVNLEAGQLDMEVLLNKDEEFLKTSVHSYLFNRRYLIVMDDLWSTNVWDDLRRYFPDNGNGSRILFTSRNKHLAPNGSIICELSLMSDENCWVLLKKKVFKDGRRIPQNLKKVGKRIARDCRGLPLAVVVIAGILSSVNNRESEWKAVEANLASCILSAEDSMMMQILELSYDNLEDHLKPCFLYFGVFRQSKRVFVAELLKLWISEGFVRKKKGEKPETVAEEYLMKLIDRSLVTVAGTRADGGIKSCVVHDLLHEFCLKRCQEENLQTSVDRNYSINKTHQRLCIRGFVSSPKSPMFGSHVRSIFGCFPESGFLNMILLRVLVLQGLVSHGSLNEIKHLINLRCMAIGYGFSPSKYEELKLAFISSLVNLEFLHIKSQFKLVCTPSSMAKMAKLRHVIVNTEASFGKEENSTNSQQPTNNVEFLYEVTIRDAEDENMLKSSPNLRGLKCKCFPFESGETGKLRYPDFGFFSQLESLHLEAAGKIHADIDDISLPPNVKDLTLSRVHLTWGEVSKMGRLRKLQNLKLLFNAFGSGVWETREGEFEQLRSLTLRSVYDLKEWRVESGDHFPRLRRLVLDDCVHLVEIPAAVGEIDTLMGVEIKGSYKESLKESIREVELQQRLIGNEELKLNISGIGGFTSETASSFYSSLLY